MCVFALVIRRCLGFLPALEFIQTLLSFVSSLVSGFCACGSKVLHLGLQIIEKGSRTCMKLVKIYIIEVEKCKCDNVKPYSDLTLNL